VSFERPQRTLSWAIVGGGTSSLTWGLWLYRHAVFCRLRYRRSLLGYQAPEPILAAVITPQLGCIGSVIDQIAPALDPAGQEVTGVQMAGRW